MKRFMVLFLAFALVLSVMPSVDAQNPPKGMSASAYKHASDEAVVHRVTDWFATRGKSDMEKQQILATRKAQRAAKRAQKIAAKRQKIMEKKARQSKAKMNKQMKGMKKSIGE